MSPSVETTSEVSAPREKIR